MLLMSAIEKYGFNQRPNAQLDERLVNELFELALDARGETKRAVMRQLTKDKKIHIIRQMTMYSETTGDSTTKRPAYYVEQLMSAISGQSHGKTRTEQLVDMVARSISGTSRQSQSLKDIIVELKVQCNCQSMSWLKEFMECGGLNTLIFVLDTMHSKSGRKHKHYEIESETLKILRLIANHHSGIADVLYQQNYLNILIQSLDSPLLTARTATMDFLLAIVTLDYPKGHKLVMSAMAFFQKVRNKARVFDALVESLSQAISSRGIFGSTVGGASVHGLGVLGGTLHSQNGGGSDIASLFTLSGMFEKSKAPTEKEVREFLVSVVALIRFLVEVPSEFEYRMYLRNEFVASGVVPAFQKLKSWARAEFASILQHVDAFEQLKIADFQYLIENLDTESAIDIYDPRQLLDTLQTQLDENDKRSVTSILQHLLVGTTLMDAASRTQMMYIIENAVMQIVLDQNGVTDFKDAFKYSVDQIIGGLQEIQRLDDENARLASLCELQEKEIMRLQDSTRQSASKSPSDAEEKQENELETHKQCLMSILGALSKGTVEVVFAANKHTIADASEAGLGRLDSATTIVSESRNSTGLMESSYRPKSKVRKMHWERVASSAATSDSVWHKIQSEREAIQDLLNSEGVYDELESMFAIAPPSGPAGSAFGSTKSGSGSQAGGTAFSGSAGVRGEQGDGASVRRRSEALEQIKIIDEKRAQNTMIFLGTIKQVSLEALQKAIRSFDESVLTETILRQCIASYATEDECTIVSHD
ncbi:hypothetical protein HK105_202641 [Polyrhizophydium stewartii]|uniref:GBD/FH3 domain-containing protein n=1 Tax=Polyrhizophydium stewartii TaxID=2732419 RepID=A0ABR4NE11_9FUNG